MMRRRPESPVTIGVIVGAIALAFVVLRLLAAADGDISRFVVAGDVVTDPMHVRPSIHVFKSAGYDGQYYWRLAANPTELHVTEYRGVRLDSELRISRIGYPIIAWLLAIGRAGWVKWSLVVSNTAGMAIIATAGASIARSRNRSALIGVALASSSGLIMSLSRDTCEVTMVAALTAGFAMTSRQRYVWGATLWIVACLAHEGALLVVIPYGAYRIVQLVRQRSWPLPIRELPWIAALAGFGLWQLIARSIVGNFPVLASGGASLDIPFKGLIEQINVWIVDGIGPVEAIVVPQLALLVTLIVIALRSAKNLGEDDRWLRWALIAAAALTASFSNNVWIGPAELRQLVVLSTVAWLIIIMSGRRIPPALVAASGTVWILTALLRTTTI